MDIEEWEAEPGGGGGVRLVVWARSGDGDWKLALELRFVRPSLFLKRALKELMNNKPEGGRETLKEKGKKKRDKKIIIGKSEGGPGERRLTRVQPSLGWRTAGLKAKAR